MKERNVKLMLTVSIEFEHADKVEKHLINHDFGSDYDIFSDLNDLSIYIARKVEDAGTDSEKLNIPNIGVFERVHSGLKIWPKILKSDDFGAIEISIDSHVIGVMTGEEAEAYDSY